MARKLTNTQMEILAERAADLIEIEYTERNKDIINSEDYLNFDNTYVDDIVMALDTYGTDLRIIQAKKDELEAKEKVVYEEVKDFLIKNKLGHSGWWKNDPTDALKKYLERKKEEVFPGTKFERDKVLRKLKADILLSNLDDTNELVLSIVNSFKNN